MPPFDPNDSSRDKMENPKIPLGASINLERYYNYLAMQGKLTVYKYTDHTNEREAKKQEIIDLAIDQQFVTRFTSMVVVEQKTRKQQKVSPEDAKIRIKHTKEWKDELEELFKDKAVKDLIKKEKQRLAEFEKDQEKARKRRSDSFSPMQAASGSKVFWVIPVLALLGLIRFKRAIQAPVRFFRM